MKRITTLLCLGALLATTLSGQQMTQQGNRRFTQGPDRQERPLLKSFTRSLQFGAVASNSTKELSFTLKNPGEVAATITEIAFLIGPSGTPESYSLDLDGNNYVGAPGDASYPVSITVPASGLMIADVTFAPTTEQYDAARLRLRGDFGSVNVRLQGLGGHEGDPYMHPVIEGPYLVVDYEDDGTEPVVLDGSSSHTHEPGHAIVSMSWKIDSIEVGTDPVLVTPLPVGTTDVELTIEDDSMPPRVSSVVLPIEVHHRSSIPGVLARYYDASGGSASGLLDAVPSTPDFGEVVDTFDVPGGLAAGGSPFAADVMVQLVADVEITTAGDYDFAAFGGVGTRLELGGIPITGTLALTPGFYELEARFAVDLVEQMPIGVTMAFDGGSADPLDRQVLTHDESSLEPIINSMPDIGVATGGNTIVIDGLGFFPASTLTLHWGDDDLTEVDFTSISASQIEFVSPPGLGPIDVTVETAQGTSNMRNYIYDVNGPVPLTFLLHRTFTIPSPTSGVWGPDGKLYATALDGRISVVEFDDDYNLLGITTHAGVSGLGNNDTLGIAINPYEPATPLRLYVAHGEHFVDGGVTPTGPSPYTGQISILEGPNFDTPIPLITGLPTSNHDHAMNAICFDNNGDLLLSVGSNTNAGIAAFNSGDLPESPFSAAILKAKLTDPGFSGAVSYVETVGGAPNADQRDGEIVDPVPGSGIELQATGIRNAFGMVFTTRGMLYANDNGPNIGFGEASTSATTQAPDPFDSDELLLVERGHYYGHPNRNRGRYEDRENVYRSLSSESYIPNVFTQALTGLASAACGIDEYRSDSFQGQMRGNLMSQKWGGNIFRIELSDSGRYTTDFQSVTFSAGLGIVVAPGGTLMALDYSSSKLRVLKPDDASAYGLVVHDIWPWRAPATGGYPFTIAGVGFGDLLDTSVTIGGIPATLTSVSSTRIEGTIPANGSPTTELLDVVVTVDTESDTHEDAFRYLLGEGLEPGRWDTLFPLHAPLGEVSAGVIDDVIYIVGEGAADTYAFTAINRYFLSNVAQRPFVGHHHASEVVDGKWYLIGGLGGGSEGKVQIYDPNLDSWSTGTDMTWAGGSVSTSVIDGKIYAAGGIVGGFTVNNVAVYDPVLDSWTALTPMPAKRNHAAAGTDGTKMYVFGGREGGNFVTNGFDDVQIYDPLLDSWEWSGDMGSTLAPLPIGRGGMGKAVYSEGEFYVFGGETLDGPGANPDGVYDRVDVYDPVANTWRLDGAMINPRHGVFPVLFEGHIFLPGGGDMAANSQTAVFDVFTRQ